MQSIGDGDQHDPLCTRTGSPDLHQICNQKKSQAGHTTTPLPTADGEQTFLCDGFVGEDTAGKTNARNGFEENKNASSKGSQSNSTHISKKLPETSLDRAQFDDISLEENSVKGETTNDAAISETTSEVNVHSPNTHPEDTGSGGSIELKVTKKKEKKCDIPITVFFFFFFSSFSSFFSFFSFSFSFLFYLSIYWNIICNINSM